MLKNKTKQNLQKFIGEIIRIDFRGGRKGKEEEEIESSVFVATEKSGRGKSLNVIAEYLRLSRKNCDQHVGVTDTKLFLSRGVVETSLSAASEQPTSPVKASLPPSWDSLPCV